MCLPGCIELLAICAGTSTKNRPAAAQFNEVTELPPIATIRNAARAAADPNSTLEKKPPSATRMPDEPPRTWAIHRALAQFLTPRPASTLNSFADPPALVSTSHEDGGLSRLSKGSTYDESIARASMSSSTVCLCLRSPSSMLIYLFVSRTSGMRCERGCAGVKESDC